MKMDAETLQHHNIVEDHQTLSSPKKLRILNWAKNMVIRETKRNFVNKSEFMKSKVDNSEIFFQGTKPNYPGSSASCRYIKIKS